MKRAHSLALALTASTGCFGDWVGTMQDDGTTGGTAASSSSSAMPATSSTSTGSSSSAGASSTGVAASSSSSGTTGSGLVCEQLNVLLLVDISVSMTPYAQGILSTVIALGANTKAVFGDLAEYHIGFTFNAPMALNADAYELPRGQTCDDLGMLLRGQGPCAEAFDGRAYIRRSDDLTQSLTCFAGGLFGPPPKPDPKNPPPSYEQRQTLGALDAFFNPEGVESVSACNAGFHDPGEPLIVVMITDEEDVSPPDLVNFYLIRAIQSQGGTSLSNVAFLVVGADPSACDDDGGSESGGTPGCAAVPSCNVDTFLDQAYAGFEDDRIRHVDLCRATDPDEVGPLAQEITGYISELYSVICE